MFLASALGSGGLTEILRAVNSHFRRGGSTSSVVVVLIVIAAILVATWFISRALKPQKKVVRGPDPQAVFERLAGKLGLTAAEQEALKRLRTLAGTHQPATILLSRALFERQIKRIGSDGRSPSSANRSPISAEVVDGLRGKLFGASSGSVAARGK